MIDKIIVEIAIGAPGLLAGTFIAPAFGRIQLHPGASRSSLPEIVNDAKRNYPVRFRPKPRQSPTPHSGSEWDTLAGWAIAAAVVIGLYIKYRTPILVGLVGIASFIALLGAISIINMARKNVVTGRFSISLSLVALFCASGIGFLLVAWLWQPPFASAEYINFLETGDSGGLNSALFVLYQIIGAISYVLVATICIGFSICVMSSVNLHVGAAGRWLWSFAFRSTSNVWSTVMPFIAIICSIMALAMSSGYAFELITSLSQ